MFHVISACELFAQCFFCVVLSWFENGSPKKCFEATKLAFRELIKENEALKRENVA